MTTKSDTGAPHEWIAVGDRLPDLAPRAYVESFRVLVRVISSAGEPMTMIDVWSGCEQGWYVHRDRVTHWQPLPSAELGDA